MMDGTFLRINITISNGLSECIQCTAGIAFHWPPRLALVSTGKKSTCYKGNYKEGHCQTVTICKKSVQILRKYYCLKCENLCWRVAGATRLMHLGSLLAFEYIIDVIGSFPCMTLYDPTCARHWYIDAHNITWEATCKTARLLQAFHCRHAWG